MKLYNSVGPNPQTVRTFVAERGIKLDMADVDLMGGENRKQAYLKINPAGQMPALILEDGGNHGDLRIPRRDTARRQPDWRNTRRTRADTPLDALGRP